MSQRTKLFKLLPWQGGLNTSTDESMIPAGTLMVADNIVVTSNRAKKSREGIDHNFDSLANGSATVVAQHDYWFGSSGSKSQRRIRVLSDGKVYSETGGTATLLTDAGKAWTGTLTSASMTIFNEKLIIAVSGTGNLVKVWDGSGSIQDLKCAVNQVGATRSSSGTTRTVKLNTTFLGANGDYIVIESAGNSAYNGTFQVTGVSTSSTTNDTITYTGTSTLAEASTADTALRLQLVAPQASVVGEHQGRLLLNDKSNNDRLHYCTTFNHQEWLGFGDSGARDIGVGDGDTRGIVGWKSFKGDLFIGKGRRMYRVTGLAPEEWAISLVSDAIGLVSHDAIVAVDNDACVFVSEKGIHDLATTASYGDFESNFLSFDIQNTFNDYWTKSRQGNIKVGYLPTINSVVFAVTDTTTYSRTNTTTSTNNALYFYNVPFKEWFVWPDVSCESMLVARDSDKVRLYLGTTYGRVSKTFMGTKSDTSKTGVTTQIRYRPYTGFIYPEADPYVRCAFKRFILYYKPRGTHSITVNVKIDSNSLNSENSLQFSESTGGTPLGAGFRLGSTKLGSSKPMAPYTRHIDGIGRGFKIEIEQTATAGEAEIHGFGVEYEVVGAFSEVV